MSSVEQLFNEAKQLPADEQLTLAHLLLTSRETQSSADVEQAWDAEIRKRIKDYDEGRTTSRPAADVFSDLDARLGT